MDKSPFFLSNLAKNTKKRKGALASYYSLTHLFGDPAGIRTQDPYIKSVLLYQLSYRTSTASKAGANIK
jgi:hypothetical protein